MHKDLININLPLLGELDNDPAKEARGTESGMDAKNCLDNKANPREKANFVSKAFFCFLLPFFKKGYKKNLTQDDLFLHLKEHDSGLTGTKLEQAWLRLVNSETKPSLWKALWKVYGTEIFISALLFVFIEIMKVIPSLLLSRLMSFYTPNTTVTQIEAYMYGFGIVLVTFIRVVCNHNYGFYLSHLGMRMRVASCSLIYRKALRLSKSSRMETTIGQMVNLLSNDVNRFDMVFMNMHHVWCGPILTIFTLYLLYSEFGLTAIIGIGLLLLFIPFQIFMGKLTSVFRLRTALCTDERVRLMNEIITGIKVIKIYAWEIPFAKLVELSRRKEILQIRNTFVIRAINLSLIIFLNHFALYLCILIHILLGNTIDHVFVYTLTAYYQILKQTMTNYLPQGVSRVAECHISVKRIEQFLMYEEVTKKGKVVNEKNKKWKGNSFASAPRSFDVGIFMQEAAAKWAPEVSNNLENVHLNVGAKQLAAVVGPVGSGKTTLLHVVLKELPLSKGSIEVRGVISYASQEPWIFSGSIRQNIIFGQKYNEIKYEQVVQVCALKRDFSLFTHGDTTIVGERGVMLSGGQKARINLARAIYMDADIYLLDDPLSAVDNHVGKQLFDQCIRGYLKDKCVVLVTHQLQYLEKVDKIHLLDKGKLIATGTYSEIKKLENGFASLLNDHKHEEVEDEKNTSLSRQSRVFDHSNKNDISGPVEIKEHMETGKLNKNLYFKYFKAGGNYIKIFTIMFVFILSSAVAIGCDLFLKFWVNLEQTRQLHNFKKSKQKNIDGNQYLAFHEWVFGEKNYLYIYSCLILLLIILTLIRTLAFFRFCLTVSRRLHNSMFNKIVHAYMYFFNSNPSGRILNRFSKDMGLIDESIPLAMMDTLETGLTVLSISLVIGSVNPYILIPTGTILIIFYGLKIVFLATSRDVKRIEGITRSPVFSHLSSSIEGLTSIRAFNAEDILRDQFDNHQNKHSSAAYLFLIASRTFGFWLDLHCVVYIGLVVVSLLFISPETMGGNVGLSITQCLKLTGMFQVGMRQWSEIENQMTSVERIIEYTEVEEEGKKVQKIVKELPKDCTEYGRLCFSNVNMRYSPYSEYVLKNVSFEIKAMEKIGIVGRTGAGKSSLISALVRLAESEGEIFIDNLNTKEMSLTNLRGKISIIPQEPVLFSGTLRQNLDPFDEYNDAVIWNALEEVELKKIVSDMPDGLLNKVSEGGSNFSVGQKQLICLARAIVRKNKILVLDEATANVDPQTDALIQSTIRKKFEHSTVLTIAHRLNTVMDSDKILVIDAGTCVEFDHPYILLQNNAGFFYSLVQQMGKCIFEDLVKIAENAYQNNRT